MNADNTQNKLNSDNPSQPLAQPAENPWQSSQPTPPVEVPVQPQQAPMPQPKRTLGQKLKHLLKSKKFWAVTILLLLAIGAGGWFVQPSRLWAVNLAGMRNTLSINTISPGEGKSKVSQLKNVDITVNGKAYKTDDKGHLQVSGVPYGEVTLSAKKAGYQDATYQATLDFDPFLHKFGGKSADDSARTVELSLKAVGIPVSFKAIDLLSGQPITGGEFTIGDVVARPDDQGVVSLKIPGTDAGKVTVSASFGGQYADKKFEVALGSKGVPTVNFVPGGKHYFVSKRSGVYTVYGSDLDGNNVEPIVTGTGQETDSVAFAVSPSGKYGVLASSREGGRNAKKDLLQRVYVVNLVTKQITRVDEGMSVNFADCSGDTLAYTTTAYDTESKAYPVTLRSVDATNNRVYNFETADAISVSTVAFDKVVYSKSSFALPNSTSSPVLREAPINATHTQTLGEQVSYDSYIQQDFDRIVFKTNADQSWHEYNLNTDQSKTIAQPTTGTNTQQYMSTASPDGSKRVLIDRIDGKYTLIIKTTAAGEQKQIYSASGLGGPIRWIGNTIVFRVVTAQETADYVVSLSGGEPKKITDVSATASIQGSVTDSRFRFY